MSEKVDVLNVNHPEYRGRVDAAKYHAMETAQRTVLAGSDGMTQSEMKDAAKPHLPDDLFPGRKTAGWWSKTVQLDLEARGEMGRSTDKPLRFFLT